MSTWFSFLEGFPQKYFILFQNDIYGGTRNLAEAQFDRYGIEYSFTEGLEVSDFEKEIRGNTKVIYIESPSNPIL